MFICMDYFQQRKYFIFSGIQKNYQFFIPFFKKENDIEMEILNLNHYYKKNMIWIGKDHIKSIGTPFWDFIYRNWEQIPRNLFILDMRSIQYNDTQLISENGFIHFQMNGLKSFIKKISIRLLFKKK